jgi:hypothetical protein
MKFKLPNKYRVGAVIKTTSIHTGEKCIYRIESVTTVEKTQNLVELKHYLNQEGFEFNYDTDRALIESVLRPINNDFINMHLTRGTILKLYNDDYNISIFDSGNRFELYRLEVFTRGVGLGSKFLNTLNRISCELDYPVFLKLGVPGNKMEYRGKEQVDIRSQFYLKNNFNIIRNGVIPILSNQNLVDTFYKNMVA